MLSFITPLWLLGLVLLPLIRWLHRGGRHRRALPVSRLALWWGSAASSPAAGERRPPDPAWRRRALFTALVFVALAGPQWPQPRARITLWVDDSLSMLTREAQGTRLALGLAQARALLAEVPLAEAEVRTLADPWRALGALTEGAVAGIVAGAPGKTPGAPPAALLARDRLHWLVTDGAHAALLEWPGNRRADRLIQVGTVTRNVGLERLAARRNASDPEKFDLLLKLTNGGTAVETREVGFVTDGGEAIRSTHRLDPGASAFVTATIVASTQVRATLQPGDALTEDDGIALALAPLGRRRVAADAKCPKALVAAVGTHPALALVPGNASDAQAVLDCGTAGAASAAPTLRVRADRTPARWPGSVQWAPSVAESGRIRLASEQLPVAAQLQVRPADAVLLAVGGEPVIVSRAGEARLIETSLDFESMGRARGPEIPLLVNLMFERLLGVRLLDAVALTDRGAGSARVAPLGAPPDGLSTASARATGESGALRDGAMPLLLLAALVLLWEIVALGRQWVRLTGYAQGQAE
ncbi:MAG: hypothetical protein Q8K96_18925 [Rubrivivax sp.]|nr:hypothetical protein [Rubrivivax sp.]